MILAALVLVALVSMPWVRVAWGHLELLYWQRACLRHSPPASSAPITVTATTTPGARSWQQFYARFSPPGRAAAPVVFLGEMRRRDGSARLVAVELSTPSNPGRPSAGALRLEYHVIRPGGLWSRPRLVADDSWGVSSPLPRQSADGVRLYPARMDPSDSSHLILRLEVGDQGGPVREAIVDGWLRDDDTILFEPRGAGVGSASADR